MSPLSKKEVRSARITFWFVWSALVSAPASLAAWILTEGEWWAAPITLTVSTVCAYNFFESWLSRRQWRGKNTIVLCVCGHENDEHKDDKQCLHAKAVPGQGFLRRDCSCTSYSAQFWQMSRQ